MNIKTNYTYNENCINTMKRLPDNFIDLTVTSPPYGTIRDYNGYDFDFEKIVEGLFRITKQGGTVVWIVGDQTIKGSESGDSFKQALFFKQIGFNIHDTMIYKKSNSPFPSGTKSNRYTQLFEYMFVFSKGKPATTNLLKDIKKTYINKNLKIVKVRQKDSSFRKDIVNNFDEYKIRDNIWEYSPGYGKSSKDKIAYKHPAIFPEKLAEDHILSWSNPGDIVFDPFMGSGTVAKISILNNRKFIGSEISKEYIQIIKARIKIANKLVKLQ